jgi:hypothetical protein
MASSRTGCNRMSGGVAAGSKWQRPASWILLFGSPKVSASVNTEWAAFASYPPSDESPRLSHQQDSTRSTRKHQRTWNLYRTIGRSVRIAGPDRGAATAVIR